MLGVEAITPRKKGQSLNPNDTEIASLNERIKHNRKVTKRKGLCSNYG